jgi:ketosteroid isomerase-like protein
MSQANMEIAKRGIDAFNRLDVSAYAEVVTPDFEWFPAMPATLEGGGYQRREGIETYYREIRDTRTELRVVVDEFRDLGDQVLALRRLVGRGLGSGLRADTPPAIFAEFRGRKVSRSRAYFDQGEALRRRTLPVGGRVWAAVRREARLRRCVSLRPTRRAVYRTARG